MSYYLLDNTPARTNFYRQRRGPVLGVVIHVTAGLQGLPTGADSSAEATARYALTVRDRQVSWHSGSDRDSNLRLLPDDYVAFHCQGQNTHTIGHEISKRDTTWADEDPRWVAKTLEQAVESLRPRVRALGIPLRRATAAELERAKATGGPPVGFLAHSDLDPSRRSDPGRDFPWARLMRLFAPPPPPNTEEDTDMRVVYAPGRASCLLRGDGRLTPLDNNAEVAAYEAAGVDTYALTPEQWDRLDAVSKRIGGTR